MMTTTMKRCLELRQKKTTSKKEKKKKKKKKIVQTKMMRRMSLQRSGKVVVRIN